MEYLPLTVTCPGCGSSEVVYSCSPDCCFNHVCGDCLGNFELITSDLGETLPQVSVRPAERDSCAPTARCARCESLDLYQLGGTDSHAGKVVCASCRALLELSLTTV
jgi:hypothetical protein